MREGEGYAMGKSTSSSIPELHLKCPMVMVEVSAVACGVMVLGVMVQVVFLFYRVLLSVIINSNSYQPST